MPQLKGKAHPQWKHGEYTKQKLSAEYRCWWHMHNRCYSPSANGYEYWGGRGIKVCKRWFEFKNFLADMGRKPSPKSKYSIHRVDNDGDYKPSNCVWATPKQQNASLRKRKKF